MKKILYVVSNSRIGGAETLLARLVEGLDRKKFEPHVIVTDAIGPLHNRYQKASATYNYLASVPNKRAAIASYAKGKGMDLIHVVNHIVMWSLARMVDVPVVASLYMDLSTTGGFAETWLPKAQAEALLLAGFVTDHEANVACVAPHMKKASWVIKGGVDLSLFKPASKNKPRTVAWVGRLTEGKGADLLIPLAKAMPDHQFKAFTAEPSQFMGPDVVRNAPKNLVVKGGLSDIRLAAELRKCRVFLSTSHTEGTPVSIVEGMASGCCPVARGVGSIPALIAKGVLYDKNASIGDIAKAIRSATIKAGKESRKDAEKLHSIHGMVVAHQRLYDKIC